MMMMIKFRLVVFSFAFLLFTLNSNVCTDALSTSTKAATTSVQSQIKNLKQILAKEYTTFFDPMYTQYYTNDVKFNDPLNNLAGVENYQKNVDLLAGRTFLGNLLFRDAGILLHKVTELNSNDNELLPDLQTRWTLRMTMKALPWAPTATFSGISLYKLALDEATQQVKIKEQFDFWDSINLKKGKYQAVPRNVGVNHFLQQVSPGAIQATAAMGSELPYVLLQRGDGYDIRRYPATVVARYNYNRRDEAFERLGRITKGASPLAPSLITVPINGQPKYMDWFLDYAKPGQTDVAAPKNVKERDDVSIICLPGCTVAVGTFTDAALEPVVKKCKQDLLQSLNNAGVEYDSDNSGDLKFAQFNAVFSMGERRGEVWVPLSKSYAIDLFDEY